MILTPEQFFEWVAQTWNECQERAWASDSCEKTSDSCEKTTPTKELDKPI